MKRILVTGATTPVGAALIARLLGDGTTEHVLAIGVEPSEQVRHLLGSDRVQYEQVDLTRERHLRRLLWGTVRSIGIDAIVHLAMHRRATVDGKLAHRLNVESTRLLLQLTERIPEIRRFVFRSYAEVYQMRAERPAIIAEDHPLDLSPKAPQWIRDRVEADLTVCTRMGLSPLSIAVLRCAECLAPNCGSQLHDYLQSRVCFRPLGFDPMLNLASLDDLAAALQLAVHAEAEGIFAIPGADTLPLSEVIARWGRLQIPVPGPLLAPLYRLRTATIGTDFRYDANTFRFHFSGVLDGRRARAELGYEPSHPIQWPGGQAPAGVNTD